MKPTTLTVKTRTGVDRVVVDFDEGRETEAFNLLRDALPALQDLDRRVRRSQPSIATTVPLSGPRSGRPATDVAPEDTSDA